MPKHLALDADVPNLLATALLPVKEIRILRRIHPILNSFSAKAGETITFTVTQVKTPGVPTFSKLASGNEYTTVRDRPPVFVREFKMPADQDEGLALVLRFPATPAQPVDKDARYTLRIEGSNGGSDQQSFGFATASSFDVPFLFVVQSTATHSFLTHAATATLTAAAPADKQHAKSKAKSKAK